MAASPYLPVLNPVYSHSLDQSIKTGGHEIDVLQIRAPNGRDLLELGGPVTFDPFTGKPALDYAAAYAMTARLSNIPVNVLEKADPAEMIDLFWLVASFFMKGQQAMLPALEKQRVALLERAAQPEPSLENTTQGHPS